MKCPSCGASVEHNARFCGQCGHRFEEPMEDPNSGAGSTLAYPSPMAVPVRDPYIGEVLNNRFVVESKLGQGGFGAVYRGTQKGTGRKVALKLLHPDLTQDDKLVARFRREGLVMCNLRDAHTVTTYDFDQTADGTLFIAMELLEGRSLHEVFHAEAPLDWRRMFDIVVQMCTSLAEAHEQSIVHRDLKPENIYLEQRPGVPEFVKILDFGIAKVMHGEGGQTTQLTATGQTLGTLEYMSPEQLMGRPLDGRSDIYTVGVLTYEMITGVLPFPDAKGPAALITAQLRQVPPRPAKVNPAGHIPPEVDSIIIKALQKDKSKRFADVDELRIACSKVLQSKGRQATVQGPQGYVGGTQALAGGAVPMPHGAAANAPASAPNALVAGQATAPAGQQGRVMPYDALMSEKPPDLRPGYGRLFVWVFLVLLALGGLVGAAVALS